MHINKYKCSQLLEADLKALTSTNINSSTPNDDDNG